MRRVDGAVGFPATWAMLALVCLAAPAWGQAVMGTVVDVDGQPISDVLVTLAHVVDQEFPEERLQRTITSASGRFGFNVEADGNYVLKAERLGLATYTSDLIRLRRGEPVDLELLLEVEPLDLEPLVVTSAVRPWWQLLQPPGLWPFFERMEVYGREGRGRFFTPRQVEMWRGLPARSALMAAIPGLSPMRRSTIGSARCEPLVFIDGAYFGPGAFENLDRLIDAHSLTAVEVYRGVSQTPVELQVIRPRDDIRCLTLSLWTRRR